MERARGILEAIVDGSRDPYEGYREIHTIYQGTSGAASELKPLFELGFDPDGSLHVDGAFRKLVVSAAVEWLQNNSKSGDKQV